MLKVTRAQDKLEQLKSLHEKMAYAKTPKLDPNRSVPDPRNEDDARTGRGGDAVLELVPDISAVSVTGWDTSRGSFLRPKMHNHLL